MHLLKYYHIVKTCYLTKEIYWLFYTFKATYTLQEKKRKERTILHLHLSKHFFGLLSSLLFFFFLQVVGQLYNVWLPANATLCYEDIA